jgi:hypothetical protein
MSCDETNDAIPPFLGQYGFFMLIVGGPGSGKTNFILNLLTVPNKFYHKIFDRVYIWSPSLHTAPSIKLPKDRTFDLLEMDDLNKIIEEQKESDRHTLLVFDDMVTVLEKNMRPMLRLIYNRRHMSATGKGSISIIVTSQKFNKVPKELRVAASQVVMFNSQNRREMRDFYEEFMPCAYTTYKKICKMVFDQPHQFLYLNLQKSPSEQVHKNFDLLKIEEPSDDEKD